MKNAKQVPFLRKSVAARVIYIIDNYADGNKSVFAKATKINSGTVSRLTWGELPINRYADKILAAYPVINRDWLLGEDDVLSPVNGTDSPIVTIAKLEERLEARNNEIRILQRHIDTLTQQNTFLQGLIKKG